ncbi:A24 family peptidase [Mycobacterium sp. ITM-2016-00318]|uniref:prepilin peptidase n=1 Tax=Mycobacterium sp. ITM-2016-00318 TaxID=2099693 RepID=UPI000CF8500F|nr:A24 family peptidase [Mycobacterium sp. ITM-2016-00318]WNG95098.1 A24 family peptidase [Mycobacterium sp. ITM-2016-00318]
MGAASVSVLAWLVVLSLYDIRERRLPNRLTVPGAIVILLVSTAMDRGGPALVGAGALAGVYLVVHLIAPTGMGAGDVKLAAGVGGLTGAFGYDVWVLAAIAAPLFTAAIACVAVVARSKITVPHGPSMCLASVAAAMLAIL